MRILDARSGAQQGESLPHNQIVRGLEFSADSGRLLVAAGDPESTEGRILVWSVPQGRRMREIRASERGIAWAARFALRNGD